MSTEPQIKGFALRGLFKYVKESEYPGGIPGLLAKLPIGAKPYFEEKILSSVWYPYAAFAVLAQLIEKEIGNDKGSALEEIGRSSGRRDLGSIFRFVTAILTIERVVHRAPAFWKRYCDTGELEVIDVKPGDFTVRLIGFPEIDPAHCQMIKGWIHGLGDGTGAKNVEVEMVSCIHRGDSSCEYRGRWS